jgi:alpha-glucosidase
LFQDKEMLVFKKHIIINVLACIICLQAVAGKKYILTSPNGKIVYSIGVEKNSVYYNIIFKGKTIVEKSPLSLLFKEGAFSDNVKITNTTIREGVENYTLVVGKAKNITDKYKELVVLLQQIQTPFLQLSITIRVFNDGLAFRYTMPQWKNRNSFTLLQEHTSINISGNPLVRTLLLPNYTTSHEGVYSKMRLSALPEDVLMDMPTLFEFQDNTFLAITEAALTDYAGMYLSKQNKTNSLTSKLSPWPSDTAVKVKSSLPHKSPWRVMLIGDRIGDLIESNIITSLNEPCKIENTSWIKPGKTTFPWWNGNVLPDTINAPGNNFVTAKYYIDFCARNKLEYHSVVEYGLHQWYVDDGMYFQPGPNADVTTPVPGLDMKEICDYAKSQNVAVRVWVHWAALYPKLDTAFTLFEKWGLSGMMVDFMDRDDQQMVNIQNEILEKAAKHHLHIQFHGAYKPTGLHRTWPNEFTREGTLNYEANKWANYITPDMDADIPFTRMLAGSTDYHLGGFRAVPFSQIKPNYTRPLMLGTRCHMLAMYVVLENYLQMVCDYPEAYEGQPGFEFIKEIPTTWDETKVLDAKPGEYIVIARRKNNNWYIGAITNGQPRNITTSFQFLEEGNFNATIYTDADDAKNYPDHLEKKTMQVNRNSTISLELAAGGGMVIQLFKK